MALIFSKKLKCPTPDNDTMYVEVREVEIEPGSPRYPQARLGYFTTARWADVRMRVIAFHSDREAALCWAVDTSRFRPVDVLDLPNIPMFLNGLNDSNTPEG